MKKGLFITFEGFEGSGKSTHAYKLYQILSKQGFGVILTKEPGGTPTGDKIREILLERQSAGLDYKAELLLFAASRSENVRKRIRPALDEGKIVISDRFFDSTTAYQGYGRDIQMNHIHYLNQFAIEDVLPDITFFLDVDSKIGLERSKMFNKGKEMRFEDEFLNEKYIEGKLFLDRVRDGYYHIAREEQGRIKIINANRKINVILHDIIEQLNVLLLKKYHKKIEMPIN